MDAVDEPDMDGFSSPSVDPLALPVKEEEPTALPSTLLDPLAFTVKKEEPTELQALHQHGIKPSLLLTLLQQDKSSDLQECYQYESPLEILEDFQQDEKPSALLSPLCDPLALLKEEKSTDLTPWLQPEDKPNLLQTGVQMDKKPTELQMGLQPNEMRSELQAVNFVTCASCATEFSSKKTLRHHFVGSNILRFCGKIFERNQPFVKLVRLKETLKDNFTFVAKLTNARFPKYVTNTKKSMNNMKVSTPNQISTRNEPKLSGAVPGNVSDVCKKKCSSKQKLAMHMLKHTGGQSGSCKVVGQDCTKKATVSKHVHKNTETLMAHCCNVCKKEFGRKSALLQHMRLHAWKRPVAHSETKQDCLEKRSNKHVESPKAYECDVCMKVIIKKKTLVEHMQIHFANWSSSCSESSNFLNTRRDLSNTRKRSGANSTYFCDFCTKELRSKCALERHLRSHKELWSFSCEHCLKAFTTKNDLTSHACKRTVPIPNYVCDICKKKFRSRLRLIGHLRLHEGRLCSSICPATFFSKRDHKVHATKSTHACGVCKKEIQSKHGLMLHMRRHTGERLISCAVCPKTFFDKSDLIMHLRKHAGHVLSIVCDVCKKQFCNRQTLLKHNRLHTGERPYACSFCPKTFISQGNLTTHEHQHKGSFVCGVCEKALSCKSSLVQHMRIHTGERPFACKVCHETFPTTDQLAAHARQHPGLVPTHVCGVCQKELSTKKNLKAHMRLHTGRPYACKVCFKAYTTQGHLALHSQSKHNRDTPFFCGICKKGLSSQYTLKQHMQAHTGGQSYSCTLCSKAYTTKNNLGIHTRNKHSEAKATHVCGICNKEVCNKFNLKLHMRIHTGERPHSCTGCSMTFISKSDLTIHERKHAGVSFDCGVCKKSMTSKSNLAQHMRIHTGDLPFACKICLKAFCRPDVLARHVKLHAKKAGPHVCDICKRGLSTKQSLKRHVDMTHRKDQTE